jgi:membrane fusion protein (multidrug efflux system)
MASKPLYIVIAAAGIAAASAAAWWYQRQPATAAAPDGAPVANAPAAGGRGAPIVVEAARADAMRLTDDAQAVGSLRSRQSVMLRPEVSGRVTRINFRDGERVRRGQVLVQLDDQLPRAQVQQARAELSIARANHKRNQELVGQGFISQRQVEESAASLQVAEAKLALAEATAARLKIVAPFDAIAGIRGINVGDYLKDGADIVNLEDLDAVYVDFRLPERFQTKLRQGQTAIVQTDALPGRRWNAVVQAIDPAVDANGRSLGVRGCIDNRQLALRPGMFARVSVIFGERDNALVVPEEAIVPQGDRISVYRLADGADGKVAQRVDVKVGLRSPGRVEITEGLRPGDLVVTAGQQRINRDGMVVKLADTAKPTAPVDATPAPAAAASAAKPSTPVAAAGAATEGAARGASPCHVAVADMPRAGGNRR